MSPPPRLHLLRPALLALALALMSGCDAGGVKLDPRDSNYARVAGTDSAMNAAIAKARATFPEFLTALRSRNPKYHDFGVKKPYATPSGGQEHMWILDVTEVAGGFEGIVSNQANDTLLVKGGDRVRFQGSEISDWKYVDGDLLVGGYTIRYFVDRMPPAERQAVEAELGVKIR